MGVSTSTGCPDTGVLLEIQSIQKIAHRMAGNVSER